MPGPDRIVIIGFYLMMMAGMAIVPVVCVIVTRRAADGRLPRNDKMGIRTPALFASERAWQAGHHAALPIIGWGTSLATMAGWWPLVDNIARPAQSAGGMGLGMLIWGGACLVAVVAASVRAGRAARRVDGSNPDR